MKMSCSVRATLVACALLVACSTDGPPPPPPIFCDPDLECQSLVESGGFVSGIASLDAFFRAALKLRGQASVLEADVTNVLVEMAAALGLNGSGSAADIAARIEAHLESGLDGKLDGALTIAFQEPRCDVSGSALVQAAAHCDEDVEPARASAECAGGCVIDAAAGADCKGELQCMGRFRSQKCNGSCEGSCELAAGTQCTGVCSGRCELDGTIACDGECVGETDADGNCTGECQLNPGAKCEGTCKGSCELSAGASCEGLCQGECTYDPGAASCDGELVCLPAAGEFVECNGMCKGEVRPPRLVAECEASTKAEVHFDATCTAPSVDVDYKLDPDWAAEADADARLEAQVHAFVRAFARLQAKSAKLKLIASAAAELFASGDGAVKGAVLQIAEGNDEIYVRMGAVCAVAALPETKALLTSSVERVAAASQAVFVVTTAVGGG